MNAYRQWITTHMVHTDAALELPAGPARETGLQRLAQARAHYEWPPEEWELYRVFLIEKAKGQALDDLAFSIGLLRATNESDAIFGRRITRRILEP